MNAVVFMHSLKLMLCLNIGHLISSFIIIILVYSLSGNCTCKHGSDFFATAQMPIGGCCGKFCTGDALRPVTSSEGGDTRNPPP